MSGRYPDVGNGHVRICCATGDGILYTVVNSGEWLERTCLKDQQSECRFAVIHDPDRYIGQWARYRLAASEFQYLRRKLQSAREWK